MRDWRNDPATDRQRSFARALGASIPDGATKGQASDIIDRAEIEADKGPATQKQLDEAAELGITIPPGTTRGGAKPLIYEAYRIKGEKDREQARQESMQMYGYLLSDEEAIAAQKPSGPYGQFISSNGGRTLCHAMPGTYHQSYFVDPETGRFRFPKYNHDKTYLVKIKDSTPYRQNYWTDAGLSKEEREAYTLRDFEQEYHCFELEVETFERFLTKPGNPYLKELKPIRDVLYKIEALIEALHFGEFCFLDEQVEKIMLKHGYVFKRDILSSEDKFSILNDLSMPCLRDLARPHGIKLGGKKIELRQRLIDSGIDFEFDSCYVASPSLMTRYAEVINGYVSEIKKNAKRFHPLYHVDIWDMAKDGGDYTAIELKIDAIMKTEYWLKMMDPRQHW